jgi:hypothetical protein
MPLPRALDGRLVLAVDVSPWLRPDASTCADRSFCHTFGRGEGKHQMAPGWPYSVVAVLETGRTSWTAVLDAVRLEPGADVAAVTTVQIREVVERLVAAGQWRPGDPEVLVILDAGYDAPRIAHLLAGLPVEILGRLRSDRVLRRPTPPRVYDPKGGRPPKHGGEFVFGDPGTWGAEQAVTTTDTRLYGKATAQAWDRLHPRLTRRAAWLDHDGPLPIIEGTVIRLVVEKLPSGGVNKPVWLWWSRIGATDADVDRCWQSFLRRFDLEHTFRLFKQTLGWTKPRLRSSEAADRWTWLGSKNRHPATRHDVGRVLVTGEAFSRPAHHKVGTKPRRTGQEETGRKGTRTCLIVRKVGPRCAITLLQHAGSVSRMPCTVSAPSIVALSHSAKLMP